METPQKRQKSWLSSLTGLVSGSRATAPEHGPSTSATPSAKTGASSMANGNGASSRVRLTRLNEQTPARHSGTFSAPPVESPESPVKRASPTRLAQRKMHDRVQGPSGRQGPSAGNVHNNAPNTYAYNTNLYSSASLGRATATPRRTTNFTSATTPRNMFRESLSRDMPSFSFTPRVPTNTMRGNFPAITPGRSLRAPGAELGTRDMDKVASTEHFAMKIPDPDPELTGEAISNMVPEEFKGKPEGMYANHYLAHLCPPEFTEEQRNQFFCILDLRRLKYGANNVFAKQDWKFNIANFAKEYEKSRSMILLRYGLYTFKTVKVSQDVFDKWRASNDVPEPQGAKEDAASPDVSSSTRPATSAPKPNGTEGILRSGKRKAQDNIDPSATAAFLPSTKRSRALDGSKTAATAADREPLAESNTPALTKSKRKATRTESADQLQRAKIQKPATTGTPAAASSATKAFFEKVANSPAKETSTSATASTPSIQVSKPASESSSSPQPSSSFKSSTSAPTPKPFTNGSLARSVLENGLKSSTASTTQNSNIFGYLSDASSAKGSGNDNADADGEDTDNSDGGEESEAQDASDSHSAVASGGTSTPQPSASLFSAKPTTSSFAPTVNAAAVSGASSDASDSGTGRSLFDRVNKGSDGQPLRAFGSDDASSTPKPGATTSLFGSKPSSERPSPEKETLSLFSGNKTWNPDSPIKFAGGASSTPAAKPLFGAASSSTPAVSSPFKLGASTTPAPAADKPTTTEKAPDAAPAAAAGAPLFNFMSKPTEAPASTVSSPSLFGAAASKPSSTPAPAASNASATALFGATSTQPAANALFSKPTPPATASATAPATTTAATPLFGSSTSTPAPSSSTLFGNTSTKTDTPSFGLKRTAEDDAAPKAASSFSNGAGSLFGNTKTSNGSASGDEPQAKKALFGSGATASSAPLFSFGAPKTNGDIAKPADSATPKPTVLFGATPASSASEAPKAGNLFGSSTPAAAAPASSGSIFGFGGNTSATAAATPAPGNLFSFGSSTAAPTQPSGGLSFGGVKDTGSAGSSFNFSVGGAGTAPASQSFRNPFASGDTAPATQAPSTFSFGAGATNGQSSAAAPSLFQFGNSASTPAATSGPGASGSNLFSFGGGSQTTEAATTPGNSFSNAAPAGNGLGSSSMFSFGGPGASSQPSSSAPMFGMQPAAGGSMFNLAPPMAGASTGTNTPFTNLGGASSLATTPATGTPEPGATQNNADNSGHQADGDEAPQEQISLTEGGPGEEDEAVVYEVRAKALKLVTKDESESESPGPKDKKSPWKTEGVGPLRILKNKASGAVRLLLRAEPRGHIALNRALLPDFTYKPEPNAKYVKLTTANETGTGLETWMLQVKTKEFAQALADALEENKAANKK